MARLELTFRVDAPPVGPDGETDLLGAESERVREEIYAALRLKPRSVAWVKLRLGTPKTARVIESLVEARRRGRAVVGTAHLQETLDETDGGDWSVLNTRQVDGSFSLWDDYPQCRAGTLPADNALNHTFVSSRFVSCYEASGLNGLEFLRCRNSGRKAGPPWFVALPKHFLGMGLDHPWLDRERWVAHVADDRNKRVAAINTGQNSFHQFWLRPSQIQQDPVLQQLLALCPPPAEPGTGLFGLNLHMAPRYFRGAQPDSDFAYLPWGEDGPNRLGKMQRHRLLAVGRRARQALTDAGLFKARAFTGVRSIATPEPGVQLLDGQADVPGPMYSATELAALRALEKELGNSR